MNNFLRTIVIVGICGQLSVGCGAAQPPVEASALPTLNVAAQPSETPTVEPQITATPTARIKITSTPIPNTITYTGESVELGDGMVRTWVRLDDEGNPLAIGVQFTEETLSSLPPGIQVIQLVLPLPSEATVTPFDHVKLDWMPKGHSPEGFFEPHFDVQFFMISEHDRLSIHERHSDTRAESKYIPAFYVPAKSPTWVVDNIGWRWYDSKAPETNGEPFTQSFVYGFFDGHMILLEPMITKAFFETRPDVTYEIKQPQEFEVSGSYPTMYAIRYDAGSGQYDVSLEGFVQH